MMTPEIPIERFEIFASGLDHPECAGDGPWDELGSAQRRQRDQDDAIDEDVRHRLGHRQPEASLANARRPDECHEPGVRMQHEVAERGKLPITPDQAGQRRREGVPGSS